MQNKAKLLNAQMNVTKVLTKDYENERLHRRGKNKPNQTQFPQKPTSTPKNHHFFKFWIIPVLNSDSEVSKLPIARRVEIVNRIAARAASFE